MSVLIIGLVVFLGIHSIRILAPNARDRFVVRLGEGRWKGVYSLVSAAGLVLIVIGYGIARESYVGLWDPPVWTRHLALTLMIPVFPLLLAAYLPGRIKAAAKHPMLLSVKIWALAHLLANGGLHDVVLFGSLLAWAVVDRISVKRRASPILPTPSGFGTNDLIAVVGGLVLYLVFLLHLQLGLLGVAPLG